jgi:hypothetical protein
MSCDAIMAALGPIDCQMTDQGARIVTQCLHPSFNPVAVYIQKHVDDRYIVHDGGEAFDIAWSEGRNPASLGRYLREQAVRYGVDYDEPRLSVRALTSAWLPNCIMAVSNAAAAATNAMMQSDVEQMQTGDADLRERVYVKLCEAFSESHVPRKVTRKSRYGKPYRFDFAVRFGSAYALVDTVTPSGISVASKFTAFSAVDARIMGGAFAVHDQTLAHEDVALLSEVADVVPLSGLVASLEREASARTRIQ